MLRHISPLCHSECREQRERNRRIYVGNTIKCSVSVATMLINIIIIERGDNSHSVAIRMHSERSRRIYKDKTL